MIEPTAPTEHVTVRALSSSGAGVADLPDGRVVFVHNTAPGDEADVQVEKSRPRWATATLTRLTTAAPQRVEPPCPLFETCGGCTLQHIAYDDQLAWKGRFVSDALARIGDVDTATPDVVPSPLPFFYRNRITLTLRRLRNGRVVAGFHALGRAGHIVDMVYECRLPERPIIAVWKKLREAWEPGARLLPPGGRLRLQLRAESDGVVLLVEGGREGWDGRPLLDAVEGLTAIWQSTGTGTPPVLVSGTDSGSPRAFRQVNDSAAALLRAHVLDVVGQPTRAIDAYCGTGDYGRALAAAGAAVVGIELDATACELARAESPPGLDIVQGSVEDHLASALPADLVLLNPPRTGVDQGVVGALLARPAATVVYVSCDPATLARDLGRLAGAYRLDDLAAFDLFPQTAHVESVAVLRAVGGEVEANGGIAVDGEVEANGRVAADGTTALEDGVDATGAVDPDGAVELSSEKEEAS